MAKNKKKNKYKKKSSNARSMSAAKLSPKEEKKLKRQKQKEAVQKHKSKQKEEKLKLKAEKTKANKIKDIIKKAPKPELVPQNTDSVIEKQEKQQENLKKRKALTTKHRTLIAAAAFILALAIIIGSIYHFLGGYKIPESAYTGYAGKNVSDRESADILLTLEQQLEYSKAIKARGDVKAFDFYCKEYVTMDSINGSGVISFGNVSSNDCALIMSIYVPQVSEDMCIYRSLAVLPGKEFPLIDKLFFPLDYGEYDAKICVAAYKMQAPYDFVGIQYADIKFYVGV